MSALKVDVLKTGVKNLVFSVKSPSPLTKDLSLTDVITLSELSHPCGAVRFESVVYAIQEKMGVEVWWKVGEDRYEYALTLESRGKFTFDGEYSSGPILGIALCTFGAVPPGKKFYLLFDMEKQT